MTTSLNMGRSLVFLNKISRCTSSGICNHQPKRLFQMHNRSGPTKEEFHAVKDDLFGELCRENVRLIQQFPIPEVNNPRVREKRSNLFTKEKTRQMNAIGRIKKISIEYNGFPENASLVMNQKISTPFNCAQHMGEIVLNRSIVAEVNGQIWDMHRPLEDNCTLRLLHMKLKDEDPYQVNRVFWRSCSFMLGAVLESALQDHIYVELHSFPSPNVRSGSFVYDVDLKLKNWILNSDETRVFSAEMIKLSRKALPFERLEVDVNLAQEMFEDNKYKSKQIPEIAQSSPDGKTICLYRLGNFVDISKGPMMTHSGHLNKCTITAVHPLPQSSEISETLYRVQGVALPSGFLLNHFAYGLIEQRGRKLNSARIPGQTSQSPSLADSISDSNKNNMENQEKLQASFAG